MGSTPRSGGWGPWSLFGLLGAVLIGGIALEVRARRVDARERQRSLIQALEEREEAIRVEFGRAMRASRREAEARTESLGRGLREEARSREEEALLKISRLDGDMEALRGVTARLDRRSDGNTVEVASIRDDLMALQAQIRVNRPMALRFKEIQKENEDSIFFIYSEIGLVNRSGSVESTIGTYGTGFVVTEEGHIATSKHVAQPWKFREFARQIALRGLEVDPESHLIAAWRAGTEVLMADGETLDLDIGYNNLKQGNLKIWAVAEDETKMETVESLTGEELEIRYHDSNDNQDLVLLKAEGGTFRPVRTAGDEVLEKLDPVMVLGFPRGLDILEKGVAESSPSLGTVRKVEDTIYVTASIIPGNSGGPVFDQQGNVVGIATRVVQGTETLGICLKMDHLLDLIDLEGPPPGLGVTLSTRESR